MELLFITASLGNASWSLICLIISLICLFIAAFISGGFWAGAAAGPWPGRGVAFGWAGMFFYVLAVALG